MRERRNIYGLALLGMVFSIIYVLYAAPNIIFADYIRLVNDYLVNLYSREMFFSADLLTRIPITYLMRIVNVTLFHYDTRFDMLSGIFSATLGFVWLGKYCQNNKISLWGLFSLFIIYFSLNQWEMLTNGTGWVHFLAISLFYCIFIVWDRGWQEKAKKNDRIIMITLPIITILGIGGNYNLSFVITLLLGYGFGMALKARKKETLENHYHWQIIGAVSALLLYLLSGQGSIGADGVGIISAFFKNPGYFITFYIHSYGSMVFGAEVPDGLPLSYLYMAGIMVMCLYYGAFWLNFKYCIYKQTMLPLFLLTYGKLNHLCVLAMRWPFGKTIYGMSSRYAIQYQAGIIGILLTVTLLSGYRCQKMRKGLCCLGLIFVLTANLYVTYIEIEKAPHRRAYGNTLIMLAEDYHNVPDEILIELFQYPNSVDIKRALDILNENDWNIFAYRKSAK